MQMVNAQKDRLRTGYTTGSCSAAAAKAAAIALICGVAPDRVELILPEGGKADWEPVRAEHGFWKVRKDAGDDPDVTNGSWIYAKVSWMTTEELEEKRCSGKGYWLEEYPGLYLDGGPGIGIATLPGLSCPVGHYAINPVPRRMILEAVSSVQEGSHRPLLVQIMIPSGVELAEKTFNPKLGIQGGISVLGTTGIVRPMSEEALLATIRLDIHMKAASGQETLLMTPGNYGEIYLNATFGLPLGEAVTCSNYMAAAAGMLAEEKIASVLFVGHIGKMIKVAAGMPNTHSRYGDRRMETLAELTGEVLSQNETARKALSGEDRSEWILNIVNTVRGANTTDEAVGYLKTISEMALAEAVLQKTADRVKAQMERWAQNRVHFEVIVFSLAHACSGRTDGALPLFEEWKFRKNQACIGPQESESLEE
jgi:cobalt-precorrin-5B (C1)-methyltransferase